MTELWNDVSSFQGQPDYAKVKSAGVSGILMKVNEGNVEDGDFKYSYAAVPDAGLKRGFYDFGWTPNSYPFEANQFIGYLRSLGGWKADDVMMLDIESNNAGLTFSQMASWVLGWCGTVHQVTGIVPWIYSYRNFIDSLLTDSRLRDYPLFLADPGETGWVNTYAGFTIVAIQYGQAPESGISGQVDLDHVASAVSESDPPATLDSVIITTTDGKGVWYLDEESGALTGLSGESAKAGEPVSSADMNAISSAIRTQRANAQKDLAAALVAALPTPTAGGLTAAQAASLADVQTHIDADMH